MKLLTPALLAASALSLVLPATAQAQSYAQPRATSYQDCEAQRQGRQVAGAIIGGLLGAVVGNELADDSNNNRRGRDHYGRRGYHGYDRYAHRDYRGHRRYDRRYRHRDRGNAEEVGTIAGAGVGALIGAGIAGGEDCNRSRRHTTYPGKPAGYGYDSPYAQDTRYGQGHYAGDTGYYEDPAYADPRYQEPYANSPAYAGTPYSQQDGLLGGPQSSQSARTYSASAGLTCRWQETRRMDAYGNPGTDQVYMCQGADGIWRPADTYDQ
ncbi:hypothetical protein [Maricaulis sp. CAU 1757]